jgi:hypothetical protein
MLPTANLKPASDSARFCSGAGVTPRKILPNSLDTVPLQDSWYARITAALHLLTRLAAEDI